MCAKAERRSPWKQLCVLGIRDDHFESLVARAAAVGATHIDISKLKGKVIKFGATVKVADEDTGEKKTYTIVGEHESDITSGLLSVSSPVARALIGKTVGDSVEVSAPSGTRSYEIIAVRYK